MAFTREELEQLPDSELSAIQGGLQEEVAMQEEAMRVLPEGEFSAPKLNNLVDALNEVIVLMPDVQEYPSFEEDITVFPGEFVDAIEMVNQIATDVGLDDMIVDVTVIGDDTDLAQAAGQLKSLAKSREFKQFLKNLPVEKTDLAEPAPTEPPPPTEGEMDEMMMMRM